MKLITLTDSQISKYRIHPVKPYALKNDLFTDSSIKHVFKWDVQAWAITSDGFKVPVKLTKNSNFTCRYDSLGFQK